MHLVAFEAVGLGQAVARAVGALGARVLVQSLVGVPPRHRGTRFHRSDGDTLVNQPFPHDDLAAIKQIVATVERRAERHVRACVRKQQG